MLVSRYISGILIIFWGKLVPLSSAETQNDDIVKDKVDKSSNITLLTLPTEEINLPTLPSPFSRNKTRANSSPSTKVISSPSPFLKSNNTAHIPAIRAYLRHEDIKKSSSRSQSGLRQAVSADGDIGPSLQSVQMAAAVAVSVTIFLMVVLMLIVRRYISHFDWYDAFCGPGTEL